MATIQRWDAVGRSCLSKRRFNGRSTFRQQQRAERSQREEVARLLAAPYRQYHLATGGFFRPCVLSSRKVRQLVAPSARSWWRQQGWAADVRHSLHFLSIADLATLWHLPQAQDLADLAFVRTSQIRTLSVPALLTTGHGYLLGTSTHAGHESPVYLPPQCLRENLFAVASTGKGKSTLFAHLMQALVEARLAGTFPGGALLMDPHGDLATLVAGHIPAPLQDAVVLLRLADREYPLGFNPLDMALAPDRDKVTDNLIGVVEALWPTSYGARTENFLEYGSKTLADANQVLVTRDPLSGPGQQFTLLDLVPLFRSENFRDGVLDLVTDQHLKNWWRQYFANLDGRQQAEFTSSLVTKMSKFASSRISRRILGQPRSTMNFAELIGQKKIVIVSCSAGEVGADLAALFGSLFLGFFTTALAEQARVSPEERRRVLVLIDEFQVLAGVNYPTMLAELRKYGGSFGLATQSLSYLDRFDRTLRPTVLTNVDHLFGFAMAEEDARLLHLPGVEAEDVVQLPNYTCYTRLTLGGERLPLFSLRLRSPDPDDAWARQELIGRSRSRYGSSLGVVEQILLECEARQRTLKGARTRKGNRGGEVIWTGLGEERVAETLEREGRRPRDRGRGGKGEREQTHAQHAAYGQEEEAHEEE